MTLLPEEQGVLIIQHGHKGRERVAVVPLSRWQQEGIEAVKCKGRSVPVFVAGLIAPHYPCILPPLWKNEEGRGGYLWGIFNEYVTTSAYNEFQNMHSVYHIHPFDMTRFVGLCSTCGLTMSLTADNFLCKTCSTAATANCSIL